MAIRNSNEGTEDKTNVNILKYKQYSNINRIFKEFKKYDREKSMQPTSKKLSCDEENLQQLQ